MSSPYQTTTLPERISIEQREGATAVLYHRRISSPLGVGLSVSAIVLYILLLLSLNTILWGSVPLFWRLVLAVAATGIFYYAVEYLVSRAEFTVERGVLRVRYRPLPLRPSASVRVDNIMRLAVEPQDTESSPERLPRYRVFAMLRSGARQVLLWDVNGRGMAVSLCQVLSAKLGVPGL